MNLNHFSVIKTLKKNPWYLVELVLGILIIVYFLFYPRSTIPDFIVCTPLCLLILAFGKKIGLYKPVQARFSFLDTLLFFTTSFLYVASWWYAQTQGKLSEDSIKESLLISLIYIYYAWFQHFLAQRYTAIRMKMLVEKISVLKNMEVEFKAAILTGIVFGILHIPYPSLMLPAAIGGSMYAYYFLKTGRLWAVVLSHALIASSWIYWGMDSNAFEEFTFIF